MYCLIFTGVVAGLKKIVRTEGLFAVYKGNGAQMVRIFPYAATQFTAYEVYKKVRVDCLQTYLKVLVLVRL